ncbi:hypothetical protein PoB_001456700 [Plakobranchus ocellatus]|uniref:Uncharacterized protein n=1 Tax=Plakobranchus ocellatus TaxID=259542 RepID=A0AAV3Z0K9_9GAST|nr:hypothetical protein PoB_001456700 [Plakobranchus ocellatus]
MITDTRHKVLDRRLMSKGVGHFLLMRSPPRFERTPCLQFIMGIRLSFDGRNVPGASPEHKKPPRKKAGWNIGGPDNRSSRLHERRPPYRYVINTFFFLKSHTKARRQHDLRLWAG